MNIANHVSELTYLEIVHQKINENFVNYISVWCTEDTDENQNGQN